MKTSRARTESRVVTRAHRLDPRQESRCSLALIMLMGLAILSVTATTQAMSSQALSSQALSNAGPGTSVLYLQR